MTVKRALTALVLITLTLCLTSAEIYADTIKQAREIHINEESDFPDQVTNGDLLVLDGDIGLVSVVSIYVRPGATATLDLNGKTLERAGDVLELTGGGKLIVTGAGGKIDNTAASETYTSAVQLSGSVGLTLQSGTIAFSGVGNAYAVNAASGVGDIVISGGTVNGGSGCAIKYSGQGKITVSGGMVTSKARLVNDATVIIEEQASGQGKTALEVKSGATVENTDDSTEGTPAAIFNVSKGNVVISGGTVSSVRNNTVLVKKLSSAPGDLTVSGGKILNTGDDNNVHAAINVEDCAATISGSAEIICNAGVKNSGTIYVNKGNLTLAGGTVKNTYTADDERYAVYANNSTVTLTNGGAVLRGKKKVINVQPTMDDSVRVLGSSNYDGNGKSEILPSQLPGDYLYLEFVKHTDASITPTSGRYNRYYPSRLLSFAFNEGTRKLLGITDGAKTLVENSDYTVLDGVYTLTRDYLYARPIGRFTLTFAMNGGKNPTANISVVYSPPVNATVTPDKADYDKYTATQGVSAALSTGSYSLISVKNGATTLAKDTDYTVSGGVYTFARDYLNAQDLGETVLTFNMSGGTDPTLTIAISDSTPIDAKVTPEKAEFDKSAAASGPDFALDPGSFDFVAIMNGETALKEGTDYTVTGDVYAISREYLLAKRMGALRLVFDMSGGADPAVEINIYSSSPIDATVTPEKTVYDKHGAQSGISFALNPGSYVLTALRSGANALKEGSDYLAQDDIYIVTKGYLAARKPGEITLTFDMDGGKDPTAVIEIVENRLLVDALVMGKDKNIPVSNLFAPNSKGKTTWTSGDDSIVKITGKGGKRTIKPVGLGSTGLNVEYADGTTATVAVTVVAKEDAATGLSIKGTLSMRAGTSKTVSAAVKPATAKDKTLKWFTTNANVATVDENGTIKAISKGKCKIYALTTAGARKVINLTVKKAK